MTRADALRNRARVVAAAEEVFGERGIDAGIDEVAARAGVGKATVYRSFPTKDHLVSAVACTEFEVWVDRLLGALRQRPAYDVLRDVLGDAAEAKAARMLAGLAPTAADVPELQAARAAWIEAVETVLEAGKAEGAIRADARPEEVVLLFGGACRMLRERNESDLAVWRRHVELVVAGFRPEPAPA